ncbi:hypothetical protein NEMBOFW57_010827 [Staphylotrichum longicolle]|uniref:Uncharacterized protein n=1 Tax=Staphylotrichum longicolle TaxID=669026 RepID=A0AAD4ENQ3_9PEZI|nr:hypothetical protein NEMBOFW57_010827 [Staphylotrichum longicolle]
MATGGDGDIPADTFPAHEAFSVERVKFRQIDADRYQDHIALMRRFTTIIQHAISPTLDPNRFPAPPRGLVDQDEGGRWRVQCLLMNAEVRYALYLRLLNDWVIANKSKGATPNNRPLPPWDVAIIFYTHLLMPLSFADDVAKLYPALWDAKVRFPLAQLARGAPHVTDPASESEWKKKYPDHPYQVITFTPDGEHTYVTADGNLDIHGYRCLSQPCSHRGTGRRHTMPMAKWSEFRLNRAWALCPSCKTLVTRSLISSHGAFDTVAKAAFDVTIFPLWDKPMRQLGPNGFIPSVLKIVDGDGDAPAGPSALQAAQRRYIRFLQLMPDSTGSILVPTLDIDLFWHTHQLHPVAYDAYCKMHIGRRAFLDPTTPETTTASLRPAPTSPPRAPPRPTAAGVRRRARALAAARTAAASRLTAACSADAAARAVVSKLDREINLLHREAAVVRPLLAVPGPRKWVGRWRVYTSSGSSGGRRSRPSGRGWNKRGTRSWPGRAPSRRGGRAGASGAGRGDEEAERARLEVELGRAVTEADVRVVSWGAVQLPAGRRTASGGPMSAVVGTEACAAPPIVGAARPDTRYVQSWRDTWVSSGQRIPPSHVEAGGGGTSMSWAAGLWDNWDSKQGASVTVAALRVCGAHGCQLCTMLLDIVSQLKPGWLSEPKNQDASVVVKRRERWQFNPTLASLGTAAIRLFKGSEPIAHLQLYRHISDEEKLQLNKADKFEKLLFGETLDIAASSDSDLAAARALRWLRHCIDNHERCRMGDSSFLPRRLLRIAFPTSDKVSVVYTDASAPVKYAVLSYCWGEDTSGVVTTVQAKLAAHAQGIAVSALPRTVQDAITRFGNPDWQRRITVDVPPGLDRQPATDHLFTGPGQVPPMRQFSLDARGWCLQEGVFPRRRLAFDGREMSWHCLETVMCECGHLDQNSCGEYAELKMRRREELAATSSGRDTGSIKADVAALNDEWLELMEEYSRRFLTRSSDKLVAISGLAGLFKRMLANVGRLNGREMHIMQRMEHLQIEFASPSHPLPGNYLAGMWKSCLLPSMAWAVDQHALLRSGRGHHARYKEYCAPSWSWASVNGPVKFPLLEQEAGKVMGVASQRPRLVWDTVVENFCCTPVAPTVPLGALESAFVVLLMLSFR